jgi:hypothetical protein
MGVGVGGGVPLEQLLRRFQEVLDLVDFRPEW